MTQSSEIVTIVSKDGKEFRVNENAIKISSVFSNLLELHKEEEDNLENCRIPILNVEGNILKEIIRYCEYHYQNKGTDNHEFIDDEDIDEWDLNLIMDLEKEKENGHRDILEVAIAADYLNIPKLFNIYAKHLARKIRSYDAEKIIKYFYIPKQEETANIN
ncbi:hypothetical protein H8356DRAFT_1274605 [Neocallimastix lanati (nom. inval.)]|uniref:E3 ubiquitin ligase complex SCF subunit n=1 Tax=Neocallimastix californiae TaxID=1754190 RepID=A0A1Y2AM43_9FUNG|nr:hypothetical protein H8356DRAFT_1274605 [Neocallimastix sp. JGI-2020a]ORY23566.1 hypothetical protein LY90DRAFT_631010 [Neocallimastix californiae]|eukprot:ORY23566.1 hypothetical protein LY90DRAFT_631010 [Neocallimastix californiae]